MFNPFDFNYTHAIVCRVPTSLKECSFRNKDLLKAELINIDRAKESHNEFIGVLRKLGLDVIELQSDDTLPDSTFVDCCSVICNGTALIAKPHLISRKKETDLIKTVLRKEGLNIIEIKDPIATLDATDVFFTGREFFVGLSKRTNIIGAKALAWAFPDYPVSLIKLKKGCHLKAYVSIAGPDLIAVGSSEIAKDILKQMKEMSEYKKYQIITVPDLHGVNCIYLNNTLLHCHHEELPNSAKLFASKIDYPRIEIRNREFSKVDRYLTCRCLLFTKKKLFSILSSNYFTQMKIGKLISQMRDEIDKIENVEASLNLIKETNHNDKNNDNNQIDNTNENNQLNEQVLINMTMN